MAINFNEIYKLNDLLNKAQIPHTFMPSWDGYQIRMYADAELTYELDDCVLHKFSHGSEKGLLETYYFGECEGHETADQVFKGWQKKYNEAKKFKKF